MADSIRERIVKNIISTLGNITTGNGYNTQMGNRVFRSLRRPLELNELPCVVVGEGKETPVDEQSFGFDRYYLELTVNGRSEFASGEDWISVGNKMLADIVKVIGTNATANGLAFDIWMKENQIGEAEEKVRAIGVDAVFVVDYRTAHLDPYT